MSTPDINWKGSSGKLYGYYIRSLYEVWKKEPGNYIYAKETYPGSKIWIALYVGQTKNLSDRLINHEKEECAIVHGATHIHAHTSSSDELTRTAEETDLISAWKPICNERI